MTDMDCTSARLPYRQTGYFSKIVLDYIDQSENIKPFFLYTPTAKGIQDAVNARNRFSTPRELLVQELKKQYEPAELNPLVNKNIESLLLPETFTITAAHQNNIFTGPLYFIYKILHAIKLAAYCKTILPQYNFVPVFYMGTEDADLAELNHTFTGGEKLEWETKQTGAVGRMKIDKNLLKLVGRMEGQLSVMPYGNEITRLIRNCFNEGDTVQDSTFKLLHALFGEYGLVVLLPDNAVLKRTMIPVFEDDLFRQSASAIVEKTAAKLNDQGYKVQAHPREINLFYLKDAVRSRIEYRNSLFTVHDSRTSFRTDEIIHELNQYPERFSPNVILRGLYQETILPNIAFVGGGGEIAYWLQLKDLFDHYKIPFPVLVLRNSFLVIEKKWQDKISKLGFTAEDFFLKEQELLNKLVARDSKNKTRLNGSFTELEQLYESFKKQALAIDGTLEKHVEALKMKTVQRLQELEKKMLRAEKRKFNDQLRQIQTIMTYLFPGAGLQERRENISYFYARWGKDFIRQLYQLSPATEQEFVIITEN